MRFDALVMASSVGGILLFVGVVLALGFDVSLSRALGQVLPLALGGALVTGLLVSSERRGRGRGLA